MQKFRAYLPPTFESSMVKVREASSSDVEFFCVVLRDDEVRFNPWRSHSIYVITDDRGVLLGVMQGGNFASVSQEG